MGRLSWGLEDDRHDTRCQLFLQEKLLKTEYTALNEMRAQYSEAFLP